MLSVADVFKKKIFAVICRPKCILGGGLFSLVSYIFNAIPTTVFLPHLLFALKSPFRNDGSGFHCFATEDQGDVSLLLVHNKVVINEYD